jgi:hypothetical protein
MQRIFISYSRTDQVFARKLANSLSDLGSDVWIDIEDIPAGMKWSTAIQEGLKSADAMLVVISPESMGSSNVEDEWQYFMDKGKPIFPILWRDTKDIHFQLNRLQYIDFKNNEYSRALSMLIQSLAKEGIILQPPNPELRPAVKAVPAQARLDTPPQATFQVSSQISSQVSSTVPTPAAANKSPNMILIGGGIAVAIMLILFVVFWLADGEPTVDTEVTAQLTIVAQNIQNANALTQTQSSIVANHAATSAVQTQNAIAVNRAATSAVQAMTLTQAAQSVSTCPGFLPSRLYVGGKGYVSDTEANNIRAVVGGSSIGTIPPGGIFNVVGGPRCDEAQAIIWWEVVYNGIQGWTAEGRDDVYWLAPVDDDAVVTFSTCDFVFTRSQAGSDSAKDAFCTDRSSGRETQLTNFGSYDVNYVSLSSSDNLLFHRRSASGGTWQIFFSPDGSNLSYLVDGLWPRWSPDATRIAYVVNSEIYIMDANGRNSVAQTTTPGDDVHYPAWSSDGSRIAFVVGTSVIENTQIYVIDTTLGSPPYRLYSPTIPGSANMISSFPDFKPNSTVIAFSGKRTDISGDTWDIYLYDSAVAAGTVQTLVENSVNNFAPRWISSTEIIYVSNKFGNYDVFMVNVNTGQQTQLTTSSSDDNYPSP